MANSTIKISQLQNIGNGLNSNSLIPVVDTTGNLTTDKANIGQLGNLILSEAGNSFTQAYLSTFSQTVVNAAQPNITSVGTLTGLNLINVATLNIPGGNNGYFLQTNGNGLLSWSAAPGSGNGAPGGANTQLQFNNGGVFAGDAALTWDAGNAQLNTVNFAASSATIYGNLAAVNVTITTNLTAANANFTNTVSNTISATGNITGNFFIGNGSQLTGITATANGAGPNNSLQYNANGIFAGDSDLTWNPATNTLSTIDISANNITLSANVSANKASITGNVGANIVNANFLIGDGSNITNIGFAANSNVAELSNSVVVEAVNNNYSYHVVLTTGPGDSTLHNDVDDNLQYNPFDGILTVTRVDSQYLEVTNSVLTNLVPFDSLPLSLGNATNPWNDLYLSNSTIYLGNATISANGNSIVVDSITVTNGNVGTIGNIASLNLDGSSSNVLYGNGVFAPAGGGGGNVSELINGLNSFVLDNDGNVVFEGNGAGQGIDRGVVWDYGANANGVNSELRQDNFGITIRAYTENGGGANGYSAPVNIVTNQGPATKTWTFDGQGNLSLPGNINAINDGGQLGAQVLLQPDLGKARLAARTLEYTQNFNSGSWTSASYTGTQVDIISDPNLLNFVSNNTIFTSAVDRTFSINGNEPVPYQGYGASGNNVTLYTDIAADPDPTVVTSIDFYYQSESYFGIDYDDGGLDMIAAGLTINIDNDQTQGPDINLRSGDDILLQAKNKALGSESEGGDINIYAGDGASDDGQGNTASTGGDIQIEAGQGGFGNSGSGSSGGFARFQGGQGGDAGVSSGAGSGGFVQINAGDGGYNGGNAQLGAPGGYVEIYAGQTTLADGVGGYVDISSGTAADGNGIAGNVRIRTPISATGQGGNWTFDGEGNLTLPNGSPYIKTSDEESTITIRVSGEANNRSQFQIGSDGGTDQFTYISSQNDTNGFASFGLNAYSGVPTSAVIGINNGTALDWTFTSAALDDTEAYLYTPAGATITTPNAPSGQTGKNIFIEAGSVDQENYNTNTGGELMLKGGRGGFNDGGGGGPGGNVNINAGESADPAGHAGNVNITAGALKNWTFDYTGNLALPTNGSMLVDGGDGVIGPVSDDLVISWDNEDIRLVSVQSSIEMQADAAFRVQTNYDGANVMYASRWEFSNNEIVNISNNFGIVSEAGNLNLSGGRDGINSGNTTISAVATGVAVSTWTFDNTGNLTLAGGNSVIFSTANSSLDPLNPNVSTLTLTPDANYNSQVLVLDPTAPGHIHLRAHSFGNIDDPAANIFLGGEATSFEITYGSNNQALIHSNNYTWTFGNDGTLLLPRDASGNTDPYLWITGGPAPSISSVDVSLGGPANFQIVSDYLNLSGYTGAKVAIKADNGEIATDANMVLTTNNANVGNTYSWTFDIDGNLTLPGNTFAVNYANGSQASAPLVDVLNTNGLTTVFYPTFVENRTDGQIVRADVDLSYRSDTNTLTVGNVVANNFSGNISITGNVTGTSPNVSLVAGSYTATFDNTGLLTLPAMGGDEGGEINLGIPTSNTSLITSVKFDVYQDRVRFFDGSTKGVYIDLSQASTGVGTLLNNRVSGVVNAGTFVTMDNIKATVTSSAPRGLSLATVTGSFAYNIAGNFALVGGPGASVAAGQTLTTTATGSIFGWGFTVSGDLSTYVLTDTTNNRCYRITLQIGASFNNNSIIIERLI